MRGIIFLAVLMTLLVIIGGCDERNPTEPEVQVTLTSDSDTLYVGNTGSSIELIAQIITNDTHGISGRQVNFQTNFGSVIGSGLTNESGYAFSSFWYNGVVTGTAVVRASYMGVEAKHEIYVVDPLPYILTVDATPDTIIIGSGVTSLITAELKDRQGIPMSGEVIGFEAPVGTITPQTTTNNNGIAVANFNVDQNEEMEIEITVTYKNATTITYIYLEETDVVYLEIRADSDTVYAGTNNNLTEIYAHLYDEFNNPVVDAHVNFTASTGSILHDVITDDVGIANTTFYFTERDIISTITGSYYGITDMIEITIKPYEFGIESVTAVPVDIYADNNPVTVSTITVRVMDSGGFPAIDKQVYFTASMGYLSEIYVNTNNQGYAITQLDDRGQAGTAHVEIECGVDDSFVDIIILEP